MTALDSSTLDPLWRDGDRASSGPSVAEGVVYVLSVHFVSPSMVRVAPVAYDASGELGCHGVPVTCQPLWTGIAGPPMPVGSAAFAAWQGPAVSGGRLLVRTDRLRVYNVPSE
jgi:hypothetical protein